MNEIKKEKIVQFFRQMLEVYDFELVIDINKDLENVFRLNDIQNGNLNGINQEEFYTLSDIIERLDTYHQDIVYIPLENKKSNNEKIAKDDWDLVAKRYLESETVERALNEIDTKKYVDLISKKEKFDIQDIIKILDEDEQFCKSVCKKYVDTMSKEMLLEIDNKILHIFIEDEYIKLKEEGKINNQNYKEYLDGNFNVYEYDSYQELYNSVIKVEIVYDLNDLELFDELLFACVVVDVVFVGVCVSCFFSTFSTLSLSVSVIVFSSFSSITLSSVSFTAILVSLVIELIVFSNTVVVSFDFSNSSLFSFLCVIKYDSYNS